MSIENLNSSKILAKVEKRFNKLIKNSDEIGVDLPNDLKLIDVIVIGSLANESFIQGKSDLDLAVVVETSKSLGNGFPMLDYERSLNSGIPWKDIGDVSGLDLSNNPIDLAMYEKKNLGSKIEDPKVYSLKKDSFVSPSDY